MLRFLVLALFVLALSVCISVGQPFERSLVNASGPLLLAGRAYRASLPIALYDIARITANAQQAGFWVRIYDGKTVTYFQGATLCTSCHPAQESVFLSRLPALYVDGGLFLLRARTQRYHYTVRPSPTEVGHYEVTVQPISDSDGFATATEILQKLAELGVVTSISLSLPLEEMTVLPGSKLPKAPEGVKLDSVLYGLSLMPDWYEFALTQQLEMWGLRVRVLIELNTANGQLSPVHNLIIEARSSSGLIRALIPVHALSDVARDPAVRIIRPPSTPRG
jgi:hypothetical protein